MIAPIIKLLLRAVALSALLDVYVCDGACDVIAGEVEEHNIVLTDGELRLDKVSALVQPLHSFAPQNIDIGQVRFNLLTKTFDDLQNFNGFTQPLDDWQNAVRANNTSLAHSCPNNSECVKNY